ncbi:hypothetical protein EPUL_001777 [Erysiphe pulchra]|uniref:Uncharacterized protein n=1 Tax=Erysiphe pulchra TaxID=225359 RepID=A0A2S4PYD6_9PEZI|nr:hypothetical protein EPUL_001777 [Erysiphe pulchra]
MSTAQSQSQTYKFGVQMPCGGCSGAVTRVLGKLEGMGINNSPLFPSSQPQALKSSFRICFNYFTAGIESFDVSMENQIATIVTRDDTVSYDTVLKTIHKTGKKITSGEANGKSMSIDVEPEKSE